MKITSICFFALLLVSQVAMGGKPNVIVIMADDIGFECYSSYGSEFYSTPNIDKLATTGARFTQAYSQPICTPSRVKIMTGRYNFRNYTKFGSLDLSQPTFAKMVKSAGYTTCIAGKWQLSPGNLDGPHQAGFDEYCLWHFAGAAGGEKTTPEFRNKGSRYESPLLFQNGREVKSTDGKYGPDLVSDFICDFIRKKKDEPFVVYYPMILVHSPFVPTPDSDDWQKKNPKKRALQHFREMVNYMDLSVGKIVQTLDETGLRENTLVIVTGDNGTHTSLTSPFPGRGEIRGGKGSMTDAGTRVAFVANWPGKIKPGTEVDSPVDFADVLPTIAEATGSVVPQGSDGQSLLPLLQGDESNARGWVFMSYSRNGPQSSPYRCFVRDAEWKLYADGTLHNVPNDWQERAGATGADAEKARNRLQPILDRILKDAPADLIRVTKQPTEKKKTKKRK